MKLRPAMIMRAAATPSAAPSALRSVLLPRRPLSTTTSTTAKSYSERMNATGRPISPHITIYAFPTIAISSILVRSTGILLTIGTTGLATMSLLGGSDSPSAFASSLAASSAAPFAKFAVGFSCVYHYMGAVRHIVWDKTAKGFTNAQMLQTSYALIVRRRRLRHPCSVLMRAPHAPPAAHPPPLVLRACAVRCRRLCRHWSPWASPPTRCRRRRSPASSAERPGWSRRGAARRGGA